MYDTESHSQFIGLRARGYSLRKIAERLGICFATASDWDHEHWEEIRDLRDHFKHLFAERFLPDYGELLDALTAELKRINAELDKRDYTKEPTWVLVNRQTMILSRLDKICANPPLLLPAIPGPTPAPTPDLAPAPPTSTLAPDLDPDLDPAPNPPTPAPGPSESPHPNAKPTQNHIISNTEPPGGRLTPPPTLAPPTPPPNPSTPSTSSTHRCQETDPCRPQAPAPQPSGVLNRT